MDNRLKSAWELAGQIDVQREGPPLPGQTKPFYAMSQLENGIKFFVLALEELGAVTEYSCEGHPYGAYVSFKAPLRLAKQIHMTSTFYLMADTHNKRPDDICDCAMYATQPGDTLKATRYTEEARVRFLTEAADKWLYNFGDRLTGLREQITALFPDIYLPKRVV